MVEPRIAKACRIIEGYEGLGGFNAKKKLYFPFQGKADADDVWTVGRGHVLSKSEIQKGTFAAGLTLEQVDALFAKDIAKRIVNLEHAMGRWTDDQFAAGLSLFYNVEEPWCPGKTPYRMHRLGNAKGCAKGMLLYIISNGEKQLGLWRRRMSEALCYMTGEVMIAKDAPAEKALQARLSQVIGPVIKPAGI